MKVNTLAISIVALAASASAFVPSLSRQTAVTSKYASALRMAEDEEAPVSSSNPVEEFKSHQSQIRNSERDVSQDFKIYPASLVRVGRS